MRAELRALIRKQAEEREALRAQTFEGSLTCRARIGNENFSDPLILLRSGF